MNGIKNIEVRKNKALASAIQKLIDENGYADIYVYCSMARHIKDYLQIENDKYVCNVPKDYESELNGKVVFKFRCYKVEEINIYFTANGYSYKTKTLNKNELCENSCLHIIELDDYLLGKKGTAIHISDLEVFDKPKELSEFYKVGLYEDLNDCFTDEKQINGKWCIPLKKAPQNMCYVEVEE